MSRSNRIKKRNNIPLIAYSHPQLLISEQYREIRANLLFSSIDETIKTIMVTSPEPSDGKSTIATNLAIVLAQQDNRVLIVDADLRKPKIHYSFNESNLKGLTSVLTKTLTLNEAIYSTYIPNLDILTSGPTPPNPSELLSSKSMTTVMEEISTMYDYIVYDTPPVLAVTDSQLLANKCDGVILVVVSEKTHKNRALRAKKQLERTRCRILGVVLNKVKDSNKKYYREYY